jgi:hypothetical protein
MPFVLINKGEIAPGQEDIPAKEVPGSTLFIGRTSDNDLQLNHPSVLAHHAVIDEENGVYILKGLGEASKQTSVNQKASPEVRLAGKGSIKIGAFTLRFSRANPQAPLVIEYERTKAAPAKLASPAESTAPVDSSTPQPVPTSAEASRISAVPPAQQTAPAQDAAAMASTPPPPPPSSPEPAKVGDEQPEEFPEMEDEHPARASHRPRRDRINFAAAYILESGALNKTSISVAVIAIVLAGVVLAIAMDRKTVLMPGGMSAKHASFANECIRCHTSTAQPMTMRTISPQVPDQACQACHKNPFHFGEHSLAPRLNCTSCHLVHKGRTILANVTGGDCVRCHADLKALNPSFDIHKSISDFGKTHPEFAVMVYNQDTGKEDRIRLDDADRLKDTSMIKLNHKLHLAPDLPGLTAGPLQCVGCHQASERKGYLMPPVKFEKACVGCHSLAFDSKYSDKTVPHGKQPAEVDLYLRILYTSLWPTSEEARAGTKLPAQREAEWINEQVAKADEKLFGKKGSRKRGLCQQCHLNETSAVADSQDDRFPRIAKTSIPERWFLNSGFSHQAHTMAKCTNCHESAPNSEATSDVLLPKINTCRQCHNASGTANPACLECHLFHEIPKPKRAVETPAPIPQTPSQSAPSSS